MREVKEEDIKAQAECFRKWFEDSEPVVQEQIEADRKFDNYCRENGVKCWVNRGSYIMLFGGMAEEEYYQEIAERE